MTLVIHILLQNKPYKWTTNRTYHHGHVTIKMLNRNRARVSIGRGVVVTVIRHKVAPEKNKVDFLGIYIENGDGFSADVHGLLGMLTHVLLMSLLLPAFVSVVTELTTGHGLTYGAPTKSQLLYIRHFKCIFFNKSFYTMIQISPVIVFGNLIDDNSVLVRVMVWRQTGDKPFRARPWPSKWHLSFSKVIQHIKS